MFTAELTANGINLVNENDARRDLLGGSEQLTHAPSTQAHKHLPGAASESSGLDVISQVIYA